MIALPTEPVRDLTRRRRYRNQRRHSQQFLDHKMAVLARARQARRDGKYPLRLAVGR